MYFDLTKLLEYYAEDYNRREELIKVAARFMKSVQMGTSTGCDAYDLEEKIRNAIYGFCNTDDIFLRELGMPKEQVIRILRNASPEEFV